VTRRAGLVLPLFSAPGSSSWGIGEFRDLEALAGWAVSAGFSRLMMLPVGTLPHGMSSPYSAMTSMGIDPIYVALDRVDDFQRAGGPDALSASSRRDLDRARRSSRIQYDAIRRVKREALEAAFQQFLDDEWSALTVRAAALAAYIARERGWLEDYALYAALAHATGRGAWRDWPPGVRDREPGALDEARRHLARDILREQYWQWLAESQWHEARRAAHDRGVTIFGDLPFMVAAESADVWARPGEYRFDVSLGVPPDDFSDTGQDWHLPTYRWDVIAAGGYAWFEERARRMAALFDGYRVDHLVGLYRTYGRPVEGRPFFSPATQADQIRQGERMLGILQASGASIVAEDLGLVPDFVRESLAGLGVPGCKVLRWQRRWKSRGQPFIPPADYPVVSAAMTGTHDTETNAVWWDAAEPADRAALADMLASIGQAVRAGDAWNADVRDAILRAVYGAGSAELFLPMQDVFGWRDRLNTPGTVGDDNWTWRLPWPVDRLEDAPEAIDRAAFCRRLAADSNRTRR